VGAYIGAAYWFTSSTSFANPAITIGRMFSDTFAGIAPGSVLSFIGAQVIGGLLAIVLIKVLYPAITPADAAGIIVPHSGDADRAPAGADPDGASRPAGQPPRPVGPHPDNN
jgi:arsenate reductase